MRRTRPARPPLSYDAAVTVPAELERARQLMLAADEGEARDLLLSLVPAIERADRDDWMLEVFAQLGQLYLVRGANDGVAECLRRIEDCLGVYSSIVAGAMPETADEVNMTTAETAHMVCRYSRRARFLKAGLAAAHGDHRGAEAELAGLTDSESAVEFPDLTGEHADLVTYARILCAEALCDDDLYAQALPLWELITDDIDHRDHTDEFADYLFIAGATGYGRFCVETGRLAEAEPWLRRAGARAEVRGWELALARTRLERAAGSWVAGDGAGTERLVSEAYPVIRQHARAHDVSRCWLYFGFTRLAVGALEQADECWVHAERHWRELGKELHIHRILLQRSWIDIFRGRYQAAVDLVAEARQCLDAWPRHSWLQYARLDDHLGTVWRAEALAEMAHVDGSRRGSALAKLQQAADLKLPAALAVDSVRYLIADADARMRWATYVSARLLAGAFAVAWEWQNTSLVSELIEYHCSRGTFGTDPQPPSAADWAATASAPVPIEGSVELPMVAGAPGPVKAARLTRLGPLPELQMDPGGGPIMTGYRAKAVERYGRKVTADEPAWSTWP